MILRPALFSGPARALIVLSLLGLPAIGPIQSFAAEDPPRDPSTAITFIKDVHVIPMDRRGILKNHSVLVRGDRIEAVAPLEKLDPPEGAAIVDAGGKAWLIPGLVDMHVHLPPGTGDEGDPGWMTASLLLANGVTTARGLVGQPKNLELRSRIEKGDLLGPTLYAAGPPLHQGNTAGPDQAREAVRDAKAKGYDLIKSHQIGDVATYEAIQAEAAALKIPVSGHVADSIGLDRAIAARQQIEHLDGFIRALVPPGGEELPPFGQFPSPEVLERVDRSRIPALARRVTEAGIWNTPTLSLFTAVLDSKTPTEALRKNPAMRFVPDSTLDQWARQRDGMLSGGGFPEAAAKEFGEVRNEIVRELARAGGLLLAGSDTPQFFKATGFALHEELEALVKAGITPWQALKAATAGPAAYLRSLPGQGSAGAEPADFGSIEPGLRADLVLLSADPLESISHTRKIRGVMVRGRWLDEKAIEILLKAVEEAAKKAG